jgi:7,8-dihydropterin-6-yl-methyl-4-(beta-D-ribofuranosyl)aminobenzene 5'-phosphate synthase
MNGNITILVDNQAGEHLESEHGFSLWIETENKHILFDTGQGCALTANASSLDIDLSKTDILVLSHGHYDHTGGMAQVLQQAGHTHVYCHSGVTQPRYSIHNGSARAIQMPHASMLALDKVPEERMHWVLEPMFFSPKIGITGPIPRTTSFEDTGGPFYLDPAGRRVDPIIDDMALWMATDQGVVVCVGCCHAGLVNTLNHVRQLSGQVHIRAVIGGFHLLNSGNERLEHTIAALRSFEPALVVPCHCTGEHATAALHDALGKKVMPGAVGVTYCF